MTPDAITTEIIAYLKTVTPLVNVVGPEIRESEWKGTAFTYPTVRVGRVMLSPYGNGNCTPNSRRVQFTVQVASKTDSSATCQQLQGLVEGALEGRHIETSDLATIAPIREQLLSPVAPDPVTQIWNGSVTFRCILQDR